MKLRKLLLGINAIKGYAYKLLVDIHVLSIPNMKPQSGDGIVVSLTSYGRRVRTSVVFYTLVSLLRQKRQPDRIVLWLASEEWNDDTLPYKLKIIKQKGVEILYCEDIKSYKKLIPSLREFHGCTIVTVDDDVIYSKDTIQAMLVEHNKYPRDIICTVARKPLIIDGVPMCYSEWDDSLLESFEHGYNSVFLFPVGVGGVLYPSGSLHNDVLDDSIFLQYCPTADDIWFWFCGLRNNTTKRYIVKSGKDFSFDALYQYLHRGAALTHSNCALHQNDAQIKRLFEYYHYKIGKVYE